MPKQRDEEQEDPDFPEEGTGESGSDDDFVINEDQQKRSSHSALASSSSANLGALASPLGCYLPGPLPSIRQPNTPKTTSPADILPNVLRQAVLMLPSERVDQEPVFVKFFGLPPTAVARVLLDAKPTINGRRMAIFSSRMFLKPFRAMFWRTHQEFRLFFFLSSH